MDLRESSLFTSSLFLHPCPASPVSVKAEERFEGSYNMTCSEVWTTDLTVPLGIAWSIHAEEGLQERAQDASGAVGATACPFEVDLPVLPGTAYQEHFEDFSALRAAPISDWQPIEGASEGQSSPEKIACKVTSVTFRTSLPLSHLKKQIATRVKENIWCLPIWMNNADGDFQLDDHNCLPSGCGSDDCDVVKVSWRYRIQYRICLHCSS